MGFVEIHFHVLPGVDDGPQTLLDAVDLARLAARDGTRAIVATPHVNSTVALDVSTLPDRVRQLAGRLRRERIPVRISAGGELAHDMVGRLGQGELEQIAQGPPGNRWLLLEAPLGGLDEAFTVAADELRRRAFGVVVAHPERSLARSAAGWPAIEHELKAGSGMQVNAWSVAGRYGERARTEGLRVLRATDRVVVSSDAHGPHRAPSLRLALGALAALGVPSPQRLVAAIPQALVTRGLPAGPAALAA